MRNADPIAVPAPRLYIGGCATGNLACLRADVGAADGAGAMEILVAEEPPLHAPDRSPKHVDDYIALLAAEAPIEQHGSGVNYCFPSDFAYEHDVHTVRSDRADAELARLGLTPDRELPAPLVAIGFSTVAGCGHRGAWRCTTARSRRWWRPCASVRRVPRRASTRFPSFAGAGSPPRRPRVGRCRRHSVDGRASTARARRIARRSASRSASGFSTSARASAT